MTRHSAPNATGDAAPTRHGARRYRWAFDVAFLCLVFVYLGILLVPANYTSTWLDPEFTGWVAPIGNAIARGMVLYDDGGHSPMPPLPAVLSYLVHGGGAT